MFDVYNAPSPVINTLTLPVVDPFPPSNGTTDQQFQPIRELNPPPFKNDTSMVLQTIPSSQISTAQSPRTVVPFSGRSPDVNSTLSRLANMDTFELLSNTSEDRKNPFDSNTNISSSSNLSGLETNSESVSESRSVMNNSVSLENPGLVMSGIQRGHWRMRSFHDQREITNGQGIGQDCSYQLQPQNNIYASDLSTANQGQYRYNPRLQFTQPQQYSTSHQQPPHECGLPFPAQ